MSQKFKDEIFNILRRYFSLSELEELIFYLNIRHDDLAGETISKKARELIGYLYRRDRMRELAIQIIRARPKLKNSLTPYLQADEIERINKLLQEKKQLFEPLSLITLAYSGINPYIYSLERNNDPLRMYRSFPPLRYLQFAYYDYEMYRSFPPLRYLQFAYYTMIMIGWISQQSNIIFIPDPLHCLDIIILRWEFQV